MLYPPYYDPEKSYEENYQQGPFGAFADGTVVASEGEPAYEVFGYKVHAPFGIPAGPLINGAFVKAALDKGFDIATYKTVRTQKYPCHPWPNVLGVTLEGDLTLEKASGKLVAEHSYHEPLSITNSFGVPSYDPELWQEDLRRAVQAARHGQLVIGSFQGSKKGDGDTAAYVRDFQGAAAKVKAAGAPVLEVNLSCPNEGTANLLCYDVERSVVVADAIKNEIGDTPLIIKIGYYADEPALADFVKKIGSIADGIAAINTIAAEVVTPEGQQALPGEGRLRSGVCGHSIKWAGLDMTRRLKTLREELGYRFTIIGVGGVTVPTDFDEYRAQGADVVMSGTGSMWHPYLAKEVKALLQSKK